MLLIAAVVVLVLVLAAAVVVAATVLPVVGDADPPLEQAINEQASRRVAQRVRRHIGRIVLSGADDTASRLPY